MVTSSPTFWPSVFAHGIYVALAGWAITTASLMYDAASELWRLPVIEWLKTSVLVGMLICALGAGVSILAMYATRRYVKSQTTLKAP
jgi:hypothetical protein